MIPIRSRDTFPRSTTDWQIKQKTTDLKNVKASLENNGVFVCTGKTKPQVSILRLSFHGRNIGIRTRDLLNPIQARYQTALYPVFYSYFT